MDRGGARRPAAFGTLLCRLAASARPQGGARMTAIAFLLSHIRAVGCAAALLAMLLLVGWAGHLVAQHRRDQARIAVAEQQLATALETNRQTLESFERYKAETARAETAVLADARRAT